MKDTDETRLFTYFHRRHDKSIVPYYTSREERNLWAASIINRFPGSRILNLGGGGKRHLAKHLGANWSVHEIDITGDCDTRLNLDQINKLPFEDEQFDTTCAFEVLEHLEKFHLIAQEMYRVSKSTMLVSLPNAAVQTISILRNRRNYTNARSHGVYSKFYGLPLDAPQDRHRWWLTFEDIVRFFVNFESEKSCSVEFYTPSIEPNLRRKLMRRLMGERLFLNLYCSNVWIKISKLPD